MSKKIELCLGCKAIKNRNFPFGIQEKDKFYIDTEGCCETQDGEIELRIFYCPVCGKELK